MIFQCCFSVINYVKLKIASAFKEHFQLQEKLCFSDHINYNLQYNAATTALPKGIYPAHSSSSEHHLRNVVDDS